MFWIIILHEYKSLTHKPRFRWDHVMLQYAVIADLIQFAPHLVQTPDFAIGLFHVLWLVWYWGLQLFHRFFVAHGTSYLSPRFRTLIRQFKGLYSTALLTSLCAPWLTGAFWNCFVSSTVATLYCNSAILASFIVFFSQLTHVDPFFHDIGSVVKWFWCIQLSVTQTGDSEEIVLCIGKTGCF